MSSTTARKKAAPRPLSAKQRNTLVTQQLLQALSVADSSIMVTAVLEAVNEWIAWDRDLAKRVMRIYGELEELQAARPAPSPVKATPKVTPIPIAAVGVERLNPYGKLDPYVLLDGYGPDQLRAVLERASAYRLREAIEVVQEREPSIKLPSKGRKDAMVDYLVEVVAGKGY